MFQLRYRCVSNDCAGPWKLGDVVLSNPTHEHLTVFHVVADSHADPTKRDVDIYPCAMHCRVLVDSMAGRLICEEMTPPLHDWLRHSASLQVARRLQGAPAPLRLAADVAEEETAA